MIKHMIATVRSDLNIGELYGDKEFTIEMASLCGKECHIKSTGKENEYLVIGLHNLCYWSGEMFEELTKICDYEKWFKKEQDIFENRLNEAVAGQDEQEISYYEGILAGLEFAQISFASIFYCDVSNAEREDKC